MHTLGGVPAIRPTAWNPAEFTYGYLRTDLHKRILMWEGLKPSQRQLYNELDIFRRFSRTAEIDYVSESELTLDPDSAQPPPPDIVVDRRTGGRIYFELGEVVEEGLAAAAAHAERECGVYGGSVDIWRPLLRVFSKKLRKQYHPQAAPVHLLLYYGVGRQASFWPFLAPDLERRAAWVQRRVDRGRFKAIWLYDAHADDILARFAPLKVPLVLR